MRDQTFEEVIRVLVADDTRLHTQLLADALRRGGSLEVIGSDTQELITRADLHNIDVLLLSSDLDDRPGGGFEVLREVRELHPDIRAVILLDSSKPNLVLGAFRAGARGVLSRQESVETLTNCVRRVHQGQIWANSQQMNLVVQALASSHNLYSANAQGMGQLSKREMEVVDSVAQGLTNREIADRLSLSPHTVKNYLFQVFDKLGVSSRVELLIMTLNRISQSESAANCIWKNRAEHDLLSDSNLVACQRAAEQGVLTAQLELARFYWTQGPDSNALIQAYRWYLIAGQQISGTSKSIGKTMTMEQLLQAERMAAEWLKNTENLSPTSIGEATDRPQPEPGRSLRLASTVRLGDA
jgi:DNA-binding NarL/FixJ family response regulator